MSHCGITRTHSGGCRYRNRAHHDPHLQSHADARCSEWHREAYGTTREQLAMVSVLMSRQAVRHPSALTRTPRSLADVLGARAVAPSIGLLECARRADGGAALIVASSRFLERQGLLSQGNAGGGDVVVLSGGEASAVALASRLSACVRCSCLCLVRLVCVRLVCEPCGYALERAVVPAQR